jgi:sugar diacid utilization regulator
MYLDELLDAAKSRGATLVAGPSSERAVEQVLILDEIGELDRAAAGALAILTHSASAKLEDYGLDLVLRRAGDRELTAVAVYEPVHVSLTASRLADLGQVAVLAIAPDQDLSQFVFGLESNLRRSADATLRRLVAVLDELRQLHDTTTLEQILERASSALGEPLHYSETADGACATAVWINGRRFGYVCAPHDDDAARIGCQLVADSVARVRLSLNASRQAARHGRSQAVTALIRMPHAAAPAAVQHARLLDLPVDGHHTVIALQTGLTTATAPAPALLERARAVAAESDPEWHLAALEHTLLLVRMVPADEPRASINSAPKFAEQLIAELRANAKSVTFFCGVSGIGDGISGLRAAADEALAALSTARAEARINMPLSIDASPLRRMMLDLLSSEVTRDSTTSLLAALDAAGPRKSETAVQTLQVYLDERGSLVAAGRRLHLHPNAVAYRIKQIKQQLGLDLDDPDMRLALQVACRTRLMDLSATR